MIFHMLTVTPTAPPIMLKNLPVAMAKVARAMEGAKVMEVVKVVRAMEVAKAGRAVKTPNVGWSVELRPHLHVGLPLKNDVIPATLIPQMKRKLKK